MLDLHIRLGLHELQDLQALHIHSEVETLSSGPARILSGFTEWQAARGARALSFGWDWSYQADQAVLHGDWSSLRTNLLLVDEHGMDLGRDSVQVCVAQWMNRASWADVLAQHLDLPLLAREADSAALKGR